MKQAGNWWVPEILGGPDRYLRGWHELAEHVKVRHHRSAVQAGGHIGVFPQFLSLDFKHVYTFEPDWENFQCLVRNADAKNVFATRAALGAVHGCKELRVQPRNTGGHQMSHKDGDVPMLRIDDLGLDDCDLLMLDLEGYEFFALLGATETIMRCKPLIIVEQNKKARNQGFQPGAIQLLLNSFNYRQREAVGENLIFEEAR